MPRAPYADFSPFLPLIYAAAPGLPQSAAEAYVREAAIRFCERTGWLEREACLETAHGVRDYPLVPDALERIVRVSHVWLDGCALPAVRDGEAMRYAGGYCIEALDSPDASLWLDDCPDHCGTLRVRWQAAPVFDACAIDARLAGEWKRALVDGALADLCLLPGQPFTSPVLAATYTRRFEAAMGRARVRRFTGRNSAADSMIGSDNHRILGI